MDVSIAMLAVNAFVASLFVGATSFFVIGHLYAVA